MHRRILALTLILAPFAHAGLNADQTPFHAYRGWWVDRFDYTNSASIVTMMNRAQTLGITDVMFQVRGQADALYFLNDGVEVYAQGRGISASFDPLGIAINEGHARGIKVHAWLNMSPLWNGTAEPTNPNHLLHTNDEFWIRNSNADSEAAKQPLNSGYVIVNPTRDDVQAHLNNVVKTVAKNYAVDGIHMDYIRLYEDHFGSSSPLNFPTDAETVGRFQQEYPGQTPTGNRANYKTWLSKEISDLVRGVRQTTKQWRPGAQLTAAVWRDADIGVDSYQQDWATWIDQGLLDAAMPMIYRKGFGSGGANMNSDSGDLYRNNVAEGLGRRGNAGIMPGLGTYMQDDPATAYNNVWNQLVYARDQGANGIQLFDYGSLYNGNAAQTAARQAITDFFAANSSAPAPVGLSNFDVDEGYFIHSVTLSGSNQNVASGTADRDTTESHAGAASQKIVVNKTAGAGSFLLRHLSGNPSAAAPASNLTLNSIGAVGFWLKTTTPNLEVAVALDDFADNTSTERGYFQNIIADGQWHEYKWFLDDVSHWDAWAGANIDGTIENLFTLDSVQFRGTADTSTIFLDDVGYNAAAVAANQWSLDSNVYTQSPDTNWTNAANWTGPVPNAVGAAANLLRRPTGVSQNVTINAPITLGTLNIDNINAYNITGSSTITLDVTSGQAAINVINRGSHTIAAPVKLNDTTNIAVDTGAILTISSQLTALAGAGLNKLGDGLLVMNNVRVGALSVNDGALRVTAKPQANDPAGDSVVSSLAIQAGAQLDLTNNSMTVDYTGASPIDSVRALLASGALTSSSADASKRLGYGEVAGTAVLIKFTYAGDGNLDGQVDITDLGDLATNWQVAGVWSSGDFDYSNFVDITDLGMLATNWQAGVGNPLGPSFNDALASVGLSGASVPEPSMVGALGTLAIVTTRQRKSFSSPPHQNRE